MFINNLLTPFREKTRPSRRILRNLYLHSTKSLFWKMIWFKYFLGKPFWYKDQYDVCMKIYPGDFHVWKSSPIQLTTNSYFDDESILNYVNKFIKPNMTVVDIGANYGQFTLYAAQFLGSEGNIYAIEPVTYSYNRLQENVNHPSNYMDVIHLSNIAITNRTGTLTMYLFPNEYSAWNSIHYHSMPGHEGRIHPQSTEVVKSVTLDKYCHNNKINHIQLLKLDVEGYEIEVLEGCSELLRNKCVENIIFEVSKETLVSKSHNPQDIIRKMSDFGLDVFKITSSGEIKPLKGLDSFFPYFINLLAKPR